MVENSRIPEAVYKGLFAIFEVLWVAHRSAGVVHNLVHDLGNTNWMCRGAFISCESIVAGRIRDVTPVVRAERSKSVSIVS